MDGSKPSPSGIKPEDLTDQVWDYIFLGTPALEALDTSIPKDLLQVREGRAHGAAHRGGCRLPPFPPLPSSTPPSLPDRTRFHEGCPHRSGCWAPTGGCSAAWESPWKRVVRAGTGCTGQDNALQSNPILPLIPSLIWI